MQINRIYISIKVIAILISFYVISIIVFIALKLCLRISK